MYYGVSAVVTFMAIDSANGKGKTGDSANFTMRLVKDGGSPAAPTNAVAEVDATNMPGLYKVTLTATEMQCQSGVLHGKSSTTGIELIPRHIEPLRLPNVDAGATGGLPTHDLLNTVAGYLDTEVAAIKAKTDILPGSFPTNFASMSIDSNGRIRAQAPLIKNAAYSGFQFVLQDSSAPYAPKTGVTSITVSRSIDGGTFSTGTLGSVTEVGNGVYKCDLGAGDLNGNLILFRAVASGVLDRLITIVPLP